MGGKAAILLVLGFSLIFLVIGHNFNNIINRSIDNSTRYYTETNAYNIAVSGANMAATNIFFDNTWDDGYSDLDYNGGKIDVYVSNPLAGSGGRVTICHIPPGNPDARHTLEVPNSALAAHLAHGDHIGACGSGGGTTDPDMITILAEGSFNGQSSIVSVELLPSKFSKFAYYSAYEPSNIWWTSGDTVWGPMHVQGNLKVANSPVFWGKVTLEGGVESYGHWEEVEVGGYWTWQRVGRGRNRHWEQVWVPQYEWQYISDADPKFYGGLEQGISVPLPSDGVSGVEAAANAGGHVFNGQDTVIITFIADSINYKFSAHDPTGGTTVLGSTLAPNGVLFVDDGTARISGTVSGRYTLGVDGRDNQGKGNIYFDDDIIYENDPRTNPNSNDLLGLVIKNEALITDNAVNANDINIHASVYVEEGGFGAENYNTRPASGNINLLGGIIQAERLAVGTFNNWGISTGFNKRYRYDNRLLRVSPPFFPGTGKYEIVSWYE